MRALRGKTPSLRIAELRARNRYSVARWFDGGTEPRLPDFLRLVQACSRRLIDLVAALDQPEHIPSLRTRWEHQQLSRKAAYELPWSHAVLRALELVDCPRSRDEQELFLMRKLGIERAVVKESLEVPWARSLSVRMPCVWPGPAPPCSASRRRSLASSCGWCSQCPRKISSGCPRSTSPT